MPESLKESVLQILLEYAPKKAWYVYGSKITDRLKSEGVQDNHQEHFQNLVSSADPSPKKKYGDWIHSQYANGNIGHSEDIGAQVKDAIGTFHSHSEKNQLKKHGISNDISSFKHPNDLYSSVESLPKEATSKSQEYKTHSQNATIHSNEHWDYIIPHTKEASIEHAKCSASGKKARWCTAAESDGNMFDHYNKEAAGAGDRFAILKPKQPKRPGEMYGIVHAAGEWQDENNTNVGHKQMEVEHERPFPEAYHKHLGELFERAKKHLEDNS